MKNLTGQYDIFYEDSPVGYLHVMQKQLKTEFSASISLKTDKILRLYCIGEKAVPIGIPAPRGNIMALERTVTNRTLEDAGLSDIIRCELCDISSEKLQVGNSGGWQSCSDISIAFADRDIKQQCAYVNGALIKYDEDRILAAIPVSSDAPFPMMPVFCFGKAEIIRGKQYVVFVTQNGEFAE